MRFAAAKRKLRVQKWLAMGFANEYTYQDHEYIIGTMVPFGFPAHSCTQDCKINHLWTLHGNGPTETCMAMLFSTSGCTNLSPLSHPFCQCRTNLPRTLLKVICYRCYTELKVSSWVMQILAVKYKGLTGTMSSAWFPTQCQVMPRYITY